MGGGGRERVPRTCANLLKALLHRVEARLMLLEQWLQRLVGRASRAGLSVASVTRVHAYCQDRGGRGVQAYHTILASILFTHHYSLY